MVDQGQILDRAHAMANAADTQVADRVADRLRPPPFARVCRQVQPGFACHVKGIAEILGLALGLIPRDAKSDDPVACRLGGTSRAGAGLFGAEVANAGDHATQHDAHVAFSRIGGLADRMQIFLPRPNVAATTKIRRQEGLGIDHARLCRLLQHGGGQARIILGGVQHLGRGFVNPQEINEITVGIVPLRVENLAEVDTFFLR